MALIKTHSDLIQKITRFPQTVKSKFKLDKIEKKCKNLNKPMSDFKNLCKQPSTLNGMPTETIGEVNFSPSNMFNLK